MDLSTLVIAIIIIGIVYVVLSDIKAEKDKKKKQKNCDEIIIIHRIRKKN